MSKKISKRRLVDWDSIEPLFKMGMNNCEICRQYEADHSTSQVWKQVVTEAGIRKEAKKRGWQRNLAEVVRREIKEKLVREEVRKSDETRTKMTDKAIVDHAATAGSKIIMRHRRQIDALLEHEDKLLKELIGEPGKVHVSNYQGDVTLTKLSLTVTEKSLTLKNLAAVRTQRIALERQAYNLDDVVEEKETRILVSHKQAELD